MTPSTSRWTICLPLFWFSLAESLYILQFLILCLQPIAVIFNYTGTFTGLQLFPKTYNIQRKYRLIFFNAIRLYLTRYAMSVQRNIEACSRRGCYRARAITLTHSECMSVASVIQHAPYYIVICGLSGCTLFVMSVCLSVRHSTWNISTSTERILLKFNI